jgi:hypothetical protein
MASNDYTNLRNSLENIRIPVSAGIDVYAVDLELSFSHKMGLLTADFAPPASAAMSVLLLGHFRSSASARL